MSWPSNDTGLSVPAVLKWLLIIASIPMFIKSFQGIVQQKTADNVGRQTGNLLLGSEAVGFGWKCFGIGVLLLGCAWAIWRFCESNID